MSGTNQVEPMEVDGSDDMNQLSVDSNNQQNPSSTDTSTAVDTLPGMTSVQDKNEAELVLSLTWLKLEKPQKHGRCIEKMLQTWFSKHKADCSVKKILEDGSIVVKIKPVPGQSDLMKLNGQTLKKDENKVIVKFISDPLLVTKIPADASLNPASSIAELQTEQVQLGEQIISSSATEEEMHSCPVPVGQNDQVHPGKQSTAVSAAEEMHSCSVPVGHFWYVNHMYKEEMKRIAEANGVKIFADVKVRFEVDQKAGSPDKALNEFTNLVQTRMIESCGSVIPLKFVDPDQWRDALKIIQKKENKLLVTLTSEEMTLRGPRSSQDIIRKFLNADTQQKGNTSEEYERENQDTSLKINMTIKDHLMPKGLTMEESYWKLMITSYSEMVAKVKTKFNVEFKESDNGQSQVNVKAFCKKDEGNASMESHALKALLRLYQKIATFPMSLPQSATAFSGSPMNNSISQSEGASSEPVLSGQSANRKHNADTPQESSATAGDHEEERCSICLDTLIKKKQLKCKHEFCEECLQKAKDANGPICPICRVVFGKIMGDQPDGKMLHYTASYKLPGFPDCDTIIIDYDIPNGTQTAKHPNPGQLYWGIRRQAYLPNNREGNEVLQLLKRAFDQRLIFTIGTSRTTGLDGQVTWNDIHHKTCITGGPQSFGYPDSNYLNRVKEELKAKGIE